MAAKTKSAIETLSLKPSEVAAFIRAMRNTKIATFVWGPPGISKSAIGKQVATSDGIAFIDLRLSQMDPTDLRGIPYPVPGGEGVRWSAPLVLPRDIEVDKVIAVEATETVVRFYNPVGVNNIHYCTDLKITVEAIDPQYTAEIINKTLDSFVVVLKDSKGHKVEGKIHYKVFGLTKAILALEEFNSAPPSVQAAAYELVLDRRQGEYIVPDGVTMLAMGNRDQDKGIAYKMGTAISNRFVHVEMKVDFDDWQRWALGVHVHNHVVGFLTAFKHELFDFNPSSASRGFATPRSWTFVSEILNNNEDLPEMVMLGILCGAVGDGIGAKFMEFRRVAAELPDNSQILNGNIKHMPANKKTEVSLAYALTTSLSYELKEKADAISRQYMGKMAEMNKSAERAKWLKEADNFIEFIITNFQAEICIMGAKSAISVHKLPFDTQRMKHFNTFTDLYKDLIMS
jgi:MoxR-like ATPase